MEFHINQSPHNSQDSSHIASERLRKAIERNKAKQVRREQATPRSQAARVGTPGNRFAQNAQAGTSKIPDDWRSPGNGRGSSAATNFESAQSRFDRLSRQTASSTPSHARRSTTVGSAREEMAYSQNRAAGGSTVTSASARRSVTGLNQEQQIIETPRKRKKAATSLAYSNAKTTRRKKVKAPNKKIQYLVKGAWIFCLVLFVRLIFTSGGIIDYYSTKDLLKLKMDEVSAIKFENENLGREIERIRNDKSYQKKLVRDNLGFIARNEYLVLFPRSTN